MASPRPDSSLQEWATKIKSLQELVDKDGADERTRLEEEIAQSRRARVTRRGQSVDLTKAEGREAIVSPMPSKAAPISLAQFMGGSATGPKLTRTRHQFETPDLSEIDPKPYAQQASPLAQVARGRGGPAESAPSLRGVPMPGMQKSTPKPSPQFIVSNHVSSNIKPSSVVQRSPQSLAASSTTAYSISSAIITLPQQTAVSTTGSVPRPISATSPAPYSFAAREKSSVSVSPVDELSQKGSTPSLTRLQGRGFVGERVKAADSPLREISSITASSNPALEVPRTTDSGKLSQPSSPIRRKSVADRWPPGSIVPVESQVDLKPGSSITLRHAVSFDKPRELISGSPTEFGKTPMSPAATSLPRRGDGGYSFATPLGPALQGRATARSSPISPKPTSTVFAGPSSTRTRLHTSVAPETSISSTTSALETMQPIPDASSAPPPNLLHLTKDRARKPKKGASEPKPTASDGQSSSGTPSRLSKPPQFRPENKKVDSFTSSLDTGGHKSSRQFSPISALSPPPIAPPLREPSTGSVKESIVGHLADTWGTQGPIDVKPAPVISRSASNDEEKKPTTSAFSASRRTSPGMGQTVPSTKLVNEEPLFLPVLARSPSPLMRPSAMDIANALSSGDSPAPLQEVQLPPSPRPSSRRKSSYDKFALASLPPLVEVDTPPPSLSRTAGQEAVKQASSHRIGPSLKSTHSSNSQRSTTITLSAIEPPKLKLDIKKILSQADASPKLSFDPSFKPISTDVLLIRGRAAAPVGVHPHIFYEGELRAIIYRCKDTKSGLASTTIWAWYGKKAVVGDDETWKLRDLKARFGTELITCVQGQEPFDLISLLGGVIAVRTGTSVHWSAENTAMHCVRSGAYGSTVLIQEVDLSSRNLCSAYSYVVSILDTVIIWRGRGSFPAEASNAASYASIIAGNDHSVVTYAEGEEDIMFWACFGDDPWANAHFWAERSHLGRSSSWIWKVDHGARSPTEFIPFLDEFTFTHTGIYVVEGILEFVVIVGKDSRGDSKSIHLALDIAEAIATHVTPQRPFVPPIHTIVLPSTLPLDLRAGHLCFIDEDYLKGGSTPSHMNLLKLEDAREQLTRTTWRTEDLGDHTFLPLGISPTVAINGR